MDRQFFRLVVIVALLVSTFATGLRTATPAAAATRPDAEQAMIEHINRARAAAGRGPVQMNLLAARVAREWAATMNAGGKLEHNPNLTGQISGPWSRVGENVGFTRKSGASAHQLVEGLHTSFMNSPGHRDNVLRSDFNQAGVGIAEHHDGTMWMAVVFIAGPTGRFPLFGDAAGSTHERAIEQIWQAGITTGCVSGRYCPANSVTRAQMATFLARAMQMSPQGGSRFADVSGGSVHEGNINALAAADITAGCGNGRFCPEASLSRAQMATFLVRALGLKPTDERSFGDVAAGHAHGASIAALADAGITKGCGGGRFCPDQPLSRAEMATFLSRAIDRGWRS